jgi:hypothetical protein
LTNDTQARRAEQLPAASFPRKGFDAWPFDRSTKPYNAGYLRDNCLASCPVVIAFWHHIPLVSPEQLHLLEAFANQIALAVE